MPVLLVCRFRPGSDAGATAAFVADGRRAAELLSARPGCDGVTLAEAADEPGVWVLVARFASAAAYRRALSPFEVRQHVVPWLATALTDAPSLYEPRVEAASGSTTDVPSVLARDAGTVRLGEASGPASPRSDAVQGDARGEAAGPATPR